MQHFGLATLSEPSKAPFAAMVIDDKALPLSALGFGDAGVLDLLDRWADAAPQLERAAGDAAGFGAARPVSDFHVHAPHMPRQVFCTGANYKKHVIGLMRDETMRNPADGEMSDEARTAMITKRMDNAKNGLPYCFIKLPSCIVGPHDEVVLPRNVEKPDWELELGVVIGRRARHVSEEDAMNHVAGFAVVNDLTARELVFRKSGIGTDWLAGKCFPTFLPFGPYIVPREHVSDWKDLNIRLSVNGQVYQNETTADMLHGIERQVAYLSSRLVLMPGDLICTGSPYGNGSAYGICLQPGDVMEGSITGLGTQRNRCVAESA